jgi:hypothetical protein
VECEGLGFGVPAAVLVMRIHPLYAKKSKVFKKGMLSLDFFGKSSIQAG